MKPRIYAAPAVKGLIIKTKIMNIKFWMEQKILLNPYNAEIFVYKPWTPKGFNHFEIIINFS